MIVYMVDMNDSPTVYFERKNDAVEYLLSRGYVYHDDMDGYFKPIAQFRGYHQAYLLYYDSENGDYQ